MTLDELRLHVVYPYLAVDAGNGEYCIGIMVGCGHNMTDAYMVSSRDGLEDIREYIPSWVIRGGRGKGK